MSEPLVKKQSRFAWLLAKLIIFAESAGYDVTLGEVWRIPEQARLNSTRGSGIINSLHCDRLAADLNLFKNGKYLKDIESHRPLGEWWEMQGEGCCWGGRFTGKNGPDPNHYSISHGGRK